METLLLTQILKWSPTAITTLLVFAVAFLIKKSDSNAKKEEERAAKLREEINKTLNSFGERLTKVEHDYVKNEFFLRELSGWKSEINRLSDQITNQFMVFSQNIIQLFNQGNK